jgi:hypothetical protein
MGDRATRLEISDAAVADGGDNGRRQIEVPV